MSRTSSIVSIVAGVATAAAVATPVVVRQVGVSSARGGGEVARAAHWVDSWASMPQLTEPGNLPPAPFTQPTVVFQNATVRTTVHVSVGGRLLRLRFSNAFGTTNLPITAVTVALPAGGAAGVSAIQPGTLHPVTFEGKPSVVIPVGAQYVSDPLPFRVAAQSNLTVTTFLEQGQTSNNITSHPGSRTNSFMVAGNQVGAADLPGAASVAHWYFLSGLEVLAPGGTAAVVMLGDSITDGRGSTTNGNDRWPDQLLARLQSRPDTADVAVINEAAGGNRILNDGLGPNGLGRIDRDVIAQSGVRWLLVFEGINDIGTAAATEAAQQQVGTDLIAAFDQIIIRAHAAGLRVFGGTITAFGGNDLYDEPTGVREATRQRVNQWIRTSRRFDAVVDFDAASRDPANPRQLLPALDTGDHLHLNPAGYKVLADAVPARLFR